MNYILLYMYFVLFSNFNFVCTQLVLSNLFHCNNYKHKMRFSIIIQWCLYVLELPHRTRKYIFIHSIIRGYSLQGPFFNLLGFHDLLTKYYKMENSIRKIYFSTPNSFIIVWVLVFSKCTSWILWIPWTILIIYCTEGR